MAKKENLINKMTKKQQEALSSVGLEEYENDISSRSALSKRWPTWFKLFEGFLEPGKSFPFEDASNVHVPIIGIACLQFQARASEALLPPKDIVKTLTDSNHAFAGRRVSAHMSWQLHYGMEEFEDGMDRLLMQQPIYGVADKKTFYDSLKRQTRSILLPIDALVVPFGSKRLEDSPRKTHALWELFNDIQAKGTGKNAVYANTKGIKQEETEVREDEPSSDMEQARKDSEGQERSLFIKGSSRLVIEQHRLWPENFKSGHMIPVIATIDRETGNLLRIEDRRHKNPETGEVETTEYFTRYPFLPNPESSYGFGFGHLLEHLNQASNSITNQLIDSGKLQNLQGGFINRRSSFKRGELLWRMGQFSQVDIGSDDIRKAIMPFQWHPPSQALFNLLQFLINMAERISTVSEAMMGQTPRSDTTATANVLAVEQGVKVFSAIHRRNHRNFKRELKKVRHWNGQVPNEKEYRMVLDQNSEEYAELISGPDEKFSMKEDYSRIFDIIPVSDPNIESPQQKISRATQAYQIGLQDPVISQDPEAMFELRNDLYTAIGTKDIRRIVKRPPMQQVQDFTPAEENSRFLKEQQSTVLPQQDHFVHIASHRAFSQSEIFGQEITARGRELMNAHIQDHFAIANTLMDEGTRLTRQ
jgi:hypothetical protein